jgi:hypothetical protein
MKATKLLSGSIRIRNVLRKLDHLAKMREQGEPGRDPGQGQRPLRGFSGKDLEQELVIPGAATTLANQAVAGGVLLQKG